MFACKLASSTLLLMAHCDLVVRYPQQMPIKGKPTAGCELRLCAHMHFHVHYKRNRGHECYEWLKTREDTLNVVKF